MKHTSLMPPKQQGAPDDFYTPAYALDPLLPYVPRDWRIWEPSCGTGNIVRTLEGHGYEVFGTDVKRGEDYLRWMPECEWDAAITNPPYSLKNEFLARAYQLGKPFAFLLPLTTLETAKRQNLFRRYGLEVIFLPFRVEFQTPSGTGSGAWFATAWFTWGLNIGQPMTFWTDPTQPSLFEEVM